MECYKDFYIHNYTFKNCSDFDESIYETGISVYEVIRIEKAVPLFLEKHLNRLFNTLDLSRLRIDESYCDFESLIDELIKKNKITDGKIKLVIHFNTKNNSKEKDVLIYFTPHYFPSVDEYTNGVNIGLCKASRTNPNAKVLNSIARRKANNVIVEKKLFEVILIDHQNYITEGSRSNIFFIQGNKIVTPPKRDVLPGITRNNILEICKQHKISIIEKRVHLSDLKDFDSLFLSGASLKVLPVRCIEEMEFSISNVLLQKIMKLYDESIKNYISRG